MRIDVDKWIDGQNGSSCFYNWSDANNRIMERIGKPSWEEKFIRNGMTDVWTFNMDVPARRYKKDGRFAYQTFYEIALTTDGQIKVILPNEIKEKIAEIYEAFEKEGMTI